MAEPESEITQAIVDQAKARDVRYRLVDLALELNAELRPSAPLLMVLDAIRKEAAAAIEDLITTNPHDPVRIGELQAIAYRARFIERTFAEIMTAGETAAGALHDESQENSTHG